MDVLRHQMINSLMAPHTDQVAEAAIRLWEVMAIRIISIVGEGGFNSLYARSVFLAQSDFPWLETGAALAPGGHRFAALKTTLEAQTPAQAGAANILLLITFTDILASLVGEKLTTSILCSAWGIDASTASKELKHE